MSLSIKRKNSMENTLDISKKYIKLEQHEHVLERPDMYIGSIQCDQVDTWVFKDQNMLKSDIGYIPGLYKIFDEILVNSIDHSIRLSEQQQGTIQVKNIKVDIDKETGIIEVLNDGDGIEIVLHDTQQVYIPELIFGNLLTSSNFSHDTERIIGGMNGIGAKACNIFSEFFEITTIDHCRKLKYFQRFEKNMTVKLEPKITKSSLKPYTSFRFKPDYAKFNCNGLSDDMYNLIIKRVYDACAMTRKDVNVYLNGEKLMFKTFEKYIDLYFKDTIEKVYEKANDRWEYTVASASNVNGNDNVSFVNGLATIRGGKHVEYIMNQIVKKLSEKIINRNKTITSVKSSTIKNNLILFLKCTIVNPTFDSQSKETLTTPVTKFGSKVEVSDKFIEKLYKTGITEKIINESQAIENKNLSKTDGKKRTNIKGIANLDDAFFAGSKKSKDCTLILTEGLSAATFAISGLSVVGREYYGVFPLKGKILNAKDASIKKISENEEITNIKKIIGLENGKEYTSENFNDLRYGKIMILSDQDRDGSHIKVNFQFNFFLGSCIQLVSYIMAKFIEIQGFYGINAYTDYKSKKAKKGNFILFSSRFSQLERYRKNVEYIYYKIFQRFRNFYSKRCQGIFHRNEECKLYLE